MEDSFSQFQALRSTVLPVGEEKDLLCIDVDHTQLCPGVPRTLPASYFFSGSGVCKGCHLMRMAEVPSSRVGHLHEQQGEAIALPGTLAPRGHPLVASHVAGAPGEELRDEVVSAALQGAPYVLTEERPDPEEEFALMASSRAAASARKRSAPKRVDKEDPTNVARYSVPLLAALMEQPFVRKTQHLVDVKSLMATASNMGYQTMKEFRTDVVREFKRALKKLTHDSLEGEMVRALRDYFVAIYEMAEPRYEAGEDCYSAACAGCEQTGGGMIMCEGVCLRSFHFACVGLVDTPAEEDKWLCPACARGIPVLHWDGDEQDYFEYSRRAPELPIDTEQELIWDPINCYYRKVEVPLAARKCTVGKLVKKAKVWSHCLNRSALPPQ